MRDEKNGLFRQNGINYLVPFILITTLFFLWGFARAILDVLNKHFQNQLHISITESSLIQVTTYMGYFLMAIPAGLFINRFGYRRGVVFGLLLFAIGSLLFVPCTEAGTLYAYLFALFKSGFMFCFWQHGFVQVWYPQPLCRCRSNWIFWRGRQMVKKAGLSSQRRIRNGTSGITQ